MANSIFLGTGDVVGPSSATDGALAAFDGTTGKLIKVGSASGVYVSSITGTANQVIASSATGAVTLSLPQDIATGSTPTFAGLALGTGTASLGTVTFSGGQSLVGTTANVIRPGVTNTVDLGTLTGPFVFKNVFAGTSFALSSNNTYYKGMRVDGTTQINLIGMDMNNAVSIGPGGTTTQFGGNIIGSSSLDVGSSGTPWRTGYFGTSVVVPMVTTSGYSSGARSTSSPLLSATEAVTLSGASTATTNIIPAGAEVVGIATTTTTTITGATGYQVGDGSDADRYGDITGTAVGTASGSTNYTADPRWWTNAARAVTLTAKTSNFTGGVVQVTVFYRTAAGA